MSLGQGGVESDGGEVPSSQTEVKSRWGREKRKWESESGCTLKMARLYHADLAELAWARYDKVMALASVPGTDGQRPGAGAEEQLDNRPDPRAREAYAFFQHGAAELRGGSVDGWGG